MTEDELADAIADVIWLWSGGDPERLAEAADFIATTPLLDAA